MCGIWTSVGATGGKAALARIIHRGPDDEGLISLLVSDTVVELGHRRLAIIDLDRRANQPMTWDGGRFHIVFNGAVYNYLELRAELEALGVSFTTESDTEVLLAALATWGESALPRLVGMFAFVLLDRERGELVAARDPFGIKPLFYTSTPYGLSFCSEIGPLLYYPGVTRRANAAAAYRYALFGTTDSNDQTLFADIKAFPPGHLARIKLGGQPVVHPEAYWKPRPAPDGRSFAEAADILQKRFLENVRLHQRAAVPIGAALSGGIDSSSIVAAMRRIGGPSLDIQTFSFVVPGHDIDESRWIDTAAKAVRAENQTVAVTPDELVRDLDRMIAIQGEPFGSTSIYAQFRVMQLAHTNGIKVMLDGQGADEIFAGYRFFLPLRLAELVSAGQISAAITLLHRFSRQPDNMLGAMVIRAIGHLLPDSLIPLGRRLAGRPLLPDWINGKWLAAQGVRPAEPSPKVGRHLHDHLVESLTTSVLPALLRYEDRNSMHFSIESRVPFLTIPLVEAALACPADYLIDQSGTSKAVFRAAMRDIVPDAILDRRDKVGFATPEKAWLQSLLPWAEEVLDSEAARRIPLFRLDRLKVRLNTILSGDDRFDFQCWRWINLVRWAEILDVHFE